MTVLFLLCSLFAPTNCEISELRSSFFQVESEQELSVYLDLCRSSNCQESEYYLAVATMWQAEYTYWPNKKYGYFNQGREMLEELIVKYPKDVELRFLRYIVQASCPPFLGYRTNIAEDYQFVEENISFTNYPEEHTKMILETIDYLKAKN